MKITIKDMVYASLLAALTGILGYLVFPLPFSPVPVTGQTFAVMLAGILLTPFQAALSMAVFLGLGSIGVPVFSGGKAGLGVLVGPTGGYLVGFLVGALAISLLVKKAPEKNYLWLGLSAVLGGIIIIHLLGTLWLSHVSEIALKEAFSAGSLPFLPGDLFKVVVAVIAGKKIDSHLG